MGGVVRTTDVEAVREAVFFSYKEIDGLDIQGWLDDDNNIAYIDDGSVALFQRFRPGIVIGHYFFKVKGKMAIKLAKEIISEVFKTEEAIMGMTPLVNLKARWMNRQLGFKSNGVIDGKEGPCELVILTKKEWEANEFSA